MLKKLNIVTVSDHEQYHFLHLVYFSSSLFLSLTIIVTISFQFKLSI